MTHFAVEKSTNGEVSEKACAADALASKATADERCMIQLWATSLHCLSKYWQAGPLGSSRGGYYRVGQA